MQLGRYVLVSQAPTRGFRDAEPFDQQRQTGTIAVLHTRKVDDCGTAAVDGLAPRLQQRRDRGEMQQTADARPFPVLDLESSSMQRAVQLRRQCALTAAPLGPILPSVSIRVITSSSPFCWISEAKSVRKLFT